MRTASSVDMPSHCSTVVPAGTLCRGLTPSSSRILFRTGLILLVLRALPPSDPVSLTVASLQVDGDVDVVGRVRVVCESLRVLAEIPAVVDYVEGSLSRSESQPRCA